MLKTARAVGPTCRLLCLGYSDVLATEQQLITLCGPDILERIEFREDSQQILRWHNLGGVVSRIAETRSLFAAMGIEADFVDIVASRGCEIVLDLNHPVPMGMHGAYDVIYDGGTMEHCFNVGQVMQNIHALTRLGGYILHLNPVNYFNHGFFNFNPTFYHDFYTQSGNRLASACYVVHGPVLESRATQVHPTAGGAIMPPKSVILVIAQKTSDSVPGWPTQTKYLNNPSLAS